MVRKILRFIINKKKSLLNYAGIQKDPKNQIKELVNRGMKLGKNVIIHPEASIDSHYCFLISIGDNSVIGRGTRILAHDATIGRFANGYGRLGRVEIKENCIISSNVTILPGVSIGPDVLVAAGSVVNKDIPPNSCVAGVPARFYSSFDKYIDKHREKIKESFIVDARDLLKEDGVIDQELINRMIEETRKGDIYMSHSYDTARERGGITNPE